MLRTIAALLVFAGPAHAAATVTWTPLNTVPTTGTALLTSGDLAGSPALDAGAVYNGLFEPFAGDTTGLTGGFATTAIGPSPEDLESGVLRRTENFDGIVVAYGAPPEDVAVVQSAFVPNVDATLTPAEGAKAVAIGDLDGDGDGDVVTAAGTTLRAHIGNGANSFPTTFTLVAGSCSSGYDLATGDYDADGLDDVGLSCNDGNAQRFVYARSTGAAFGAYIQLGPAGSATSTPTIELADVTGDGRDDVIWTTDSSIFMQRSGLPGVTTIASVTGVRDLEVIDLDHDGTLDLGVLLAVGGNRLFRPYFGEGNGATYRVGTDQVVDSSAIGIELIRLTADRAPELVVARSGGLDTFRSAPFPIGPAPTSLGSVTVGQQSATLPLTLTNIGAGRWEIGALSLTGPNFADFSLVDDDCSLRLLETDASCTVTVSMQPSAAGTRSATLAIPSNAPSVNGIGLSGTGVAPNSGPTGPTGPAGTPGGAGVAGPAGPEGPAGPAGTAGPRGLAGPSGPTGATGPAGSAGTKGKRGKKGKKGKKGKRGKRGRSGKGQAGRQGRPGRPSRPGRPGDNRRPSA